MKKALIAIVVIAAAVAVYMFCFNKPADEVKAAQDQANEAVAEAVDAANAAIENAVEAASN